MPGKPARCVYKLRGQRCKRNGTGNPPLCRAHMVAFEQEARTASSGPVFGSGIVDAFSEFLNRGKIRKDSAERAAFEVFTILGAMGSMPQSPPVPPAAGGAPWYRTMYEQAQQQARARVAQQQVDPDELARRRARSTLGFGPEPLTADMIKARRRELAMQNHPDRGGSADRMAQINDAADVLLQGMS